MPDDKDPSIWFVKCLYDGELIRVIKIKIKCSKGNFADKLISCLRRKPDYYISDLYSLEVFFGIENFNCFSFAKQTMFRFQ